MGVERVAIVGLGQIGSELAAGFRECGITVEEIHRDQLDRLGDLDACRCVVLAVPEDVLAEVAARLPEGLRDRAVLVQNELVPATWRDAGIVAPTVAVVWFERKGGTPPRPILTTPVAGPHARLVVDALARRSIPADVIEVGAPLARALVAKNLYILVSNLAGLGAARRGVVTADVAWPDGVVTMGELFGSHLAFARALAREIFTVEHARLERGDRALVAFDDAWATVAAATDADPDHRCLGRSAPSRLARVAARARALDVAFPILSALMSEP